MKIKKLYETIWRLRVLSLFLVVAFFLWYIIKLSGSYTTEISIPFKILSDGENDKWIENPDFSITANCQTDGKTILSYKHNLGTTIDIPISKLNLKRVSQYGYQVDNGSLLRALQTGTNDLNINYIKDTNIVINLSSGSSKKVPIVTYTDITYAQQYMNTNGKIIYRYDSVEIRAPKIILDTINCIKTKTIKYHNLDHSINSSIDFIIPDNVICKYNKLPYAINVERCAQYKYTVEIFSNYYHNNITIVPKYVTLFLNIPLSSKIDENKIKAYIDFPAQNSSSHYVVKLKGTPKGSEIIAMEPKYVDVFWNED